MKPLIKSAANSARKIKSALRLTALSYPKNVECNICGWSGSHFLSDEWHEHIICPNCFLDVRHRLFFAALLSNENFSLDKIFAGKKILHFAAEDSVKDVLQKKAKLYVTADFIKTEYDLRLNMSEMPEIEDGNFDVVIAFDVLEHVPDYRQALKEVRRILSPNGLAIFTVPQKDNLEITFDDPSIVTAEDRTKYYGQSDHLRIFGNDFSAIVESEGFDVTVIDENDFPKQQSKKQVLFPPQLSEKPLATNFRKIFFCRKV